MKKMILAFILINSILIAKFNQEEFDKKNFYPSIKLGITLSKITDSAQDNLNSKFGFEVGSSFIYKINTIVYLQTEFLFTQKGYLITNESSSDYHYTLNYLQVPLLSSFKLGKNINLYAGGYISYFINSWISASNVNSSELTKEEDLLEADINNIDLGGALGFIIRSKNILFDLRFERGFKKINKTSNLDKMNQSFKLSVAWIF